MTRYSAMNLCICTVFLASLSSIAAGLSLKDLSIEIRQLKQNDAAKEARLEELELKVQHLENKLMEQEKDCKTSQVIHTAVGGTSAHLLEKQASNRNAIFRTCRELHQADPSLNSGMYWIDPDGQGVGDDPIYVECDMKTGKTSVLHDSEDPTDVGHCADPGCYSKPIKYSASMRQMDALSELSSECHQSIKYDCNFATFESNGLAQSWWNDRNGVAQYFWSGNNNSVHTCQCGIDHNCVESFYLCNCDSSVPVLLNDSGVITDKKYLPITRLNFGRTQLETSSGVHTLGRFECSGQVSLSGMPKSCSDLWKIGHTLSGIYSVMGSNYIESVYCDFTKLPYEPDFQVLIGYSDVKSLLVHFDVQKDISQNVTGKVSFELTRLNIGGAMDASSGIFTAPRSGIYSFDYSAIGRFPAVTSLSYLGIALMVNDVDIGRGLIHTNDDNSILAISFQSIVELKTGDQVWINVPEITTGVRLYDDYHHYTHFTGHLLQENVASSLELPNSPS